MAGHENDRDVNVRLGELGLKIEPALSGQPDIEHEAAGSIRKLAAQQVRGRTEHLGPQAYRSQQVGERVAHGGVIVNDENNRLGLRLLLRHDSAFSKQRQHELKHGAATISGSAVTGARLPQLRTSGSNVRKRFRASSHSVG